MTNYRFLPFFLCLILILSFSNTASYASTKKDVKNFYIKTVHVDGKANVNGDDRHSPEKFPDTNVPEGGGIQLSKPNTYGAWRVRTFTFMPSQMIVFKGDKVRLHFIGVQGMSHPIHVEGEMVDEKFTVKRGQIKTIEFVASKAGQVEIECYKHLPSMTAHVLILDK